MGAKKTSKSGRGEYPDVDTYTISVDQSGISPPPFSNAREPKDALYTLFFGKSVGYLTKGIVYASCDGVSTLPGRLGDGQSGRDRAREFVVALQEMFAAHGFTAKDDTGTAWTHRDHSSSYVFHHIAVDSEGRFTAEASCGMQVVKYVINDHATAQEILDAAADEDGLI